MKAQSLFAAGWFAAVALAAGSLSAADARLQQLTDQLRGRTARLIFETGGLFGDASNYRALETHGRAIHDTAESLFRTAGAASPSHEHLDKDLAALDHYRVQFDKECDVLTRELRRLWGDRFVGSFVEDDLRLLGFRLDSIARLSAAIDRHVHPGRADSVPPGDLSSRPGTWCPVDVIPVPALPDLPLPVDPRPVDPTPADPALADPRPIDPLPMPGTGGAGLGPAPIPDGALPSPRIPDGLVPGPDIRRPDVDSLIPPPGIGGSGSGSGSGSGPTGRTGIPRDRLLSGVGDSILGGAIGSGSSSTGRTGIPRDRLLPGVGDSILIGAIGSGSGSTGRTPGIPRDRLLPGVGDSILGSRPGGGSGRGTGAGLPGSTLIPGSLGDRGTGGVRLPLPSR
jgi:hypothetical protein